MNQGAGYAARRFETGDGLSIFFRDYPGPDDARCPVVCLHGLTRNSEDFEELAPHLAHCRRVLVPDMRGRGLSSYDPRHLNYHPGTYARDVTGLLDELAIERCVVVGTSMGGLIAMRIAWEDAARLAAVVLNDVGPEIAEPGLQRILKYTGRLPPANDWPSAVANVRLVLGPAIPAAGPDDPVWMKQARRTYRLLEDGRLELKSDTAIGDAVLAGAGADGPDPWDQFDALAQLPVLCLRGASSDILSAETLAQMQARDPDLQVQIVAGRGHAPLLDEPDALGAIDRFLEEVP